MSSSRRSRRNLCVGLLLLATCAAAAPAAPLITQAGFRSPARTSLGEVLIVWGQPLSTSVTVTFSDGAGGSVSATPLWVDAGRGMLAVRVPDTARTGPLKIIVDLVESPGFFLRVKTTPFSPGTDEVSGNVTSGGAPFANAAVILARLTGCDEGVEIWDVTLTDADGYYMLHGQDGDYMLMFWPPLTAGLAGDAAFVTLSATPVVQDLALVAGTTVNGSVVDSGPSATPIAGARIAFEGQVHAEILCDANGEFTIHLTPGEWGAQVWPPPGDRHAYRYETVAIEATSPQDLAPFELSSGVFISGTVTRGADGRPMPGAEMYAQTSGGSWGEVDRQYSRGSGNFNLVVPPNQTYDIYARFDRESIFTDRSQTIYIADADATLNFTVPDCATITGVMTDTATGQPAAEVEVEAAQDQQQKARTETCVDGSYRLRVAPGATGYVVQVSPWSNPGYAAQAWNNTAAGTAFLCEGTPITLTNPGDTRGSINFSIEEEAVIEGHFYTQASGCGETLPDNLWVGIDDGEQHDCNLGAADDSAPGAYRVRGLPPSSVVAGLRACVHPFALSPQCYSLKPPPAYTPISVSAGEMASDIDFCLGDTPTTEVTGLTVERQGETVVLSWAPTEDPYHFYYVVRGGYSATPSSPPGCFPDDPPFYVIGATSECSLSVPEDSMPWFLLVTSAGPSGVEGPSGSYEPEGSPPE